MNHSELLSSKISTACWIAKCFFDRSMGSGSTGNLSFLHEGQIYITASGTCFGNLTEDQFSRVNQKNSEILSGKPSKELPLHRIVYESWPDAGAVIHLHSVYATLWSCLPHENPTDCVPQYTPYLHMKMGTTGLIPYAKPGSEELFSAFRTNAIHSDGWLLANHGLVVKGRDLMDAFACAEELEVSCRLAWELRGKNILEI